MNTFAVVTVRYNSTRLPGKALLPIKGKPMLQHIIDRAKMSKVEDVVVATTTQSQPIIAYCEQRKIKCAASYNEDDLVGRLMRTILYYPCTEIVRIWGDCPLIEPQNINRHIELLNEYDYVFDYTEMKGKAVSIITAWLIKDLARRLKTPYERENFHTVILENPKMYNALILGKPYDEKTPNCSVDTKEDLENVERILELE